MRTDASCNSGVSTTCRHAVAAPPSSALNTRRGPVSGRVGNAMRQARLVGRTPSAGAADQILTGNTSGTPNSAESSTGSDPC